MLSSTFPCVNVVDPMIALLGLVHDTYAHMLCHGVFRAKGLVPTLFSVCLVILQKQVLVANNISLLLLRCNAPAVFCFTAYGELAKYLVKCIFFFIFRMLSS